MGKRIDLKNAGRDIVRCCADGKRPFVFIVGAGISYPQVPLASEIIQEAEQIARDVGHEDTPAFDNEIDEYSYWLEKAFPSSKQRQEYFHELILNKPISPANLRLAHILEAGRAASIVITPNFDDMLSRALTLFRTDFIVCDHGETVNRINPEREDAVQIAHVHGTHWNYDVANLSAEVEDAASGTGFKGMAALVRKILLQRSPIVIGYSGWENDAIMTVLRQRLGADGLEYPLYWFCHSAAGASKLPNWLTKHGDVKIVVPAEPREQKDSGKETPGEQSELKAADSAGEPKLHAVEVFDELIQGFELDSPALTKDPVGFFADHVAKTLHYDDTSDGDDPYAIKQVIGRMKRAAELEAQDRAKQDDVQKMLDELRDQQRRSQYEQMVTTLEGVDPTSIADENVLWQFLGLAEVAANGLDYEDEAAIPGWSRVVQIAENGAERFVAGGHPWNEHRADALLDRGVTYGRRDELDLALEDFTAIADMTDAPAEQRARALYCRGVTYGELDDDKKELADYSAVIEMTNAADEVQTSALMNRGITYHLQGNDERALADYTAVIKMIDVPSEAQAKSFWGRGLVHANSGKIDAARADYDAGLALDGITDETRTRLQELLTGLDEKPDDSASVTEDEPGGDDDASGADASDDAEDQQD